VAKKQKNVFDEKIDLNKEINSNKKIEPYGTLLGILVGGIVGFVLSFIFKVDLGYVCGLFPGLAIGLIVDISNSNKKK